MYYLNNLKREHEKIENGFCYYELKRDNINTT